MFTRRLAHLYLLACLMLLVQAGRLFHLQILSVEEDYEGKARSKLYSNETVDAMRGTIRDRHGTVLARDEPRFDLMIDYALLRDPDRYPEWLPGVAEATGRPREELLERVEEIVSRVQRIRAGVDEKYKYIREEVSAHEVLRDVPLGVVARVEAQPDRFPGCHIQITRARVYPQGRTACHVVGNLGPLRRGDDLPPDAPALTHTRAYKNGMLVGKTGLERQYDRNLTGVPGFRTYRINLDDGRRELVNETPSRVGDTLWLALDARVQQTAEEALKGVIGALVIMDVHTGHVIAMAGSPGYDLNTLDEEIGDLLNDQQTRPLLNRGIQDPISLGSVIKVAIAAGALQERAIAPSTVIHCPGVIRLGRRRFACSGNYAHGDVTVREAIEHSCNIFFGRVGLRLGDERIAKWPRAFGLGSKTGVDLPFEWAGRIPGPDWNRAHLDRGWYAGDTVNLSVGQGDVQVTPLQVAVMMAAIANGGRVPEPRLMRRITDHEGKRVFDSPARVRRRLSLRQSALDAVREGMARVPVTGTARRNPLLREMKVAGKTGTADIGTTGSNNAWFAGYAPHDAPTVSFAAVVQRTDKHGSDAAAPMAEAALWTWFHPERPAGDAEEAAE